MFKPLELFIGLRYLRAKRRNHFISFISMSSVIGISLGIVVIITVLSVMNGFQSEIRDRMLQMTAHATLLELDGSLADWQSIAERLQGHEDIVAQAPFVEGQVMLVKGKQVTGVMLRGIEPNLEGNVSSLEGFIVEGDINSLQDSQFNIFMGAELATYLGVSVGERITLITPEASVTPAGIMPKLKRLQVAGIYQVGMNQIDRNTAVVHIADAQRLFRMKDEVSGIRLKLNDLFQAPLLARALNQSFEGKYWVTDWTRSNRNFFRAIKMEKTMMFIIMILIVAVAVFNVVSMLVMVVTDKQSDIAILRTMGFSPRSVMWVFIIQGSMIGLVGTVLGVAGGLILASNLQTVVAGIESLLQVKFLDASVYYISDLPSKILASDVMIVAGLSFFLTVIATLYPALRAAKTQPAAALRYE
ncbi:lipoprotein-releasing ABC transporter permease subunit [Gammaproteobacteria bacterium]|nr:lipoprotein-releasing ABC transporter permease subunit [Gammaproteobacteria bacterium]